MKRVHVVLLAMVLILSVGAACQAIAEVRAQALGVYEGGTQDETEAPGNKTAAPDGGGEPSAAVDLTPLLQAVVSLSVSLITAFLIPWIRARYSIEQQQRIVAAYQIAVYAAEQMFGAGTGEKKLQWVVEQLEAKGFLVDRTVIEAEVRKMQSLGAAVLTDRKTDNAYD